MLDGSMQGSDCDLVKIWRKMNAKRFDRTMLKTKTVSARALPEGIDVIFASAEEGGAGSWAAASWACCGDPPGACA
jgi:dihydrolipoamide dehydrogenase